MEDSIFRNLMAQADKLRRHNKQLSYKSRERYFEAYGRFLRYLAEEFRLQRIANVSFKHVAAYVWHMQDNEKSASTVKTDLAGIRFWHDQIPRARYVLPPNDALGLERRTYGGVDRSWSRGEYERLVAAARGKNHEDFAGCFILAREAGLRIHECMRTDVAMARDAMKKNVLTIKGKGGKVREVPVNQNAAEALGEAAARTPPGHKLFVPKEEDTHVAIRRLQNFIRDQRRSIQDEGRVVPLTMHGGRHSYAAETFRALLEGGAGEAAALWEVSRRLGHERKDVTRIYICTKKSD